MRRILLVLTVAALMAGIMVAWAVPAFASASAIIVEEEGSSALASASQAGRVLLEADVNEQTG